MVMTHSQISLTNPLIVAYFRHDLFVRAVGLFVALGMLLLLIGLVTGRLRTFNLSSIGATEPRNRTFLRMSFGAIWLVDGILQFQPSMPLGLGTGVVGAAIPGTPGWLHSLMNSGIVLWNEHPLAFAVGTAWIQVGIGIALMVSNGRLGRSVALVSAAWAAMIWLIGNGAGGIFSPTGSILFGWPGATLFYVIAGLWLAGGTEVFKRTFSRSTLRLLSVILTLGALRQCLPSDGFWQGGNANALTAMTQSMTQVAQPHWIASLALHGGNVAGTIGGGANLIIIFWLLISAGGLWFASDRAWNWPVWSTVAFALVFWVVAQDVAFFGGLATDFNSLVPLAVLCACAAPRFNELPLKPSRLPKELRSLSGGVVASFATAMIVFSVASMAWATTQPIEKTFYEAANGLASHPVASEVAPPFTLTDQNGKTYTLGEHRDHYVLLTFLDPVCWTDCPLLAAQLKSVRSQLSTHSPIDIVAVAANPLHESLADVQHFVAQHQLRSVPNFFFVTGSNAHLKKVWNSFGISVLSSPKERMSIHADYFFIIDPSGHLQWIIPDDPLNGGSAQQGSAEAEVLSLLHQLGVR
jgi:cytochrome oxidase Cu insertion factor (SCO1/SenC/PrrC family)